MDLNEAKLVIYLKDCDQFQRDLCKGLLHLMNDTNISTQQVLDIIKLIENNEK